jgi:hypothetical protein
MNDAYTKDQQSTVKFPNCPLKICVHHLLSEVKKKGHPLPKAGVEFVCGSQERYCIAVAWKVRSSPNSQSQERLAIMRGT